MFNPFDMFKKKTGSEFFLMQSKENIEVVKDTVISLINSDEEVFCNRDVIWDALDICNLTKSDFDQADWDELWQWLEDTYEYEFWY